MRYAQHFRQLHRVRGPVLLCSTLLISSCGGNSDVQFCFSTAENCSAFGDGNRAPVADADAPAEARSGESVTLDGSDSRDPDGTIDAYSWVQIDGPEVTLTDSDGVRAGFIAPAVTTAEILRFRLTVVDNDNASDADEVSVGIQPAGVSLAQTGLRLLAVRKPYPLQPEPSDSVEPDPGAQDLPASLRLTYIGLWLQLLALEGQRAQTPDQITRQLDEARVLLPEVQQLHCAEPAGIAEAVTARGLSLLAGVVADRDPGLAERLLTEARRFAGAASVWTADETVWDRMLIARSPDHATLTLFPGSPADQEARAQRWIRAAAQNPGPADPLALASATRLLLAAATGTGRNGEAH